MHRPPVPVPARAHKAEGGNQNGSVTFTGYRQLECSLTPALRMKASAHERQALTNLLTRTKKKKKATYTPKNTLWFTVSLPRM